MMMTKWEYTVVPINIEGSDFAKLERRLDEYGAEGWELTAVQIVRDFTAYTFKRPVKDEPIDDGWCVWVPSPLTSGPPHVPETVVTIRKRNGEENIGTVSCFRWNHLFSNGDHDIVAYKVG